MSAILDVQNIRKHFGTTRAVDDVSFQVRPGEIKGLLGPNGAGKTTAIRMIMGIIPPDQGRITFAMNGGTNSIPKEKIGYFSPTLTDFFSRRNTVLHMTEEGSVGVTNFFDSFAW